MVSSLDTLPAVRVSDVLPVPVDWLPLSVVAGIVCLWLLIGSRWDVLPVAVDWWPLGCAACGCGLVAAGMCCLSVSLCRCQFPRWCWLSVSDGLPQFQR